MFQDQSPAAQRTKTASIKRTNHLSVREIMAVHHEQF